MHLDKFVPLACSWIKSDFIFNSESTSVPSQLVIILFHVGSALALAIEVQLPEAPTYSNDVVQELVLLCKYSFFIEGDYSLACTCLIDWIS